MKATHNPRSMYGITGVAGEYFVAAELSRRGWIATVTLKNTPNIDVLATTLDGSRTINIQVKTRSPKNRQGWIFNKGIEKRLTATNSYIVLVKLRKDDELPDYFVIPKNLLAREIAKRHLKWLSTSARDGKQHADNPIRNFKEAEHPKFGKYRNNWDTLLVG